LGEVVVRLLLTYIVTVIVGEFFAIQLGLQLDKLAPSFALPMALGLFFGVLALGWPLAVMICDRFLTPKMPENA
jgi:hypothetical protein